MAHSSCDPGTPAVWTAQRPPRPVWLALLTPPFESRLGWDRFPMGSAGSNILGLGVQALRRLDSFYFLPLGAHAFGRTGLLCWGKQVGKRGPETV